MFIQSGLRVFIKRTKQSADEIKSDDLIGYCLTDLRSLEVVVKTICSGALASITIIQEYIKVTETGSVTS